MDNSRTHGLFDYVIYNVEVYDPTSLPVSGFIFLYYFSVSILRMPYTVLLDSHALSISTYDEKSFTLLCFPFTCVYI